MGPQHPSTHGVFRMDVVLDGERVVKLKPVFGYLHRNHEKIGEDTTYLAFDALHRPARLFLLADQQLGLCATRGKARRTAGAGARRIHPRHHGRTDAAAQNHACLVGFLLQDMGALGTPLMYAFREREKILDLFEALTGARMMCNFMRFGGCRCDLPAGWLEQAQTSWSTTIPFLDEFDTLLIENEILHGAHPGCGRAAEGTRDQRRHHRPDAARQRSELRHPQGGSLRHLRPLRVPRSARRPRRCVMTAS